MGTQRRSMLALLAGLGAWPLLARAEERAEEEDCGCSPAKSDSSGRANRLYQRALKTEDPQRRQRLLELALKIDPQHQGAKAALAEGE